MLPLAKTDKAVFQCVYPLPERSLLLLKENSLLGPSNGHSSLHEQQQAARMEGIQ